jgi:hypothetical protein
VPYADAGVLVWLSGFSHIAVAFTVLQRSLTPRAWFIHPGAGRYCVRSVLAHSPAGRCYHQLLLLLLTYGGSGLAVTILFVNLVMAVCHALFINAWFPVKMAVICWDLGNAEKGAYSKNRDTTFCHALLLALRLPSAVCMGRGRQDGRCWTT